jgi:phage terminase small subunit
MTKKQRVFIEEYLQCWNATEAALRAGYSKRSARVTASKLLTKTNIQEKIQKRIHEKAMSADEVLIRLAEQARGVPNEYRNELGQLDIKKLMDDGKGHLIKKDYKNAQGRVIEFYDAQHALELLGKHHKLFADRQEYEGEINIRIIRDGS